MIPFGRHRSVRGLVSSQHPSKAVLSGCGTLHGNEILGSHYPHSTVSLLFQRSHISITPQKSQPTPASRHKKPDHRTGKMPTHKLNFFFLCLCSSITLSCKIKCKPSNPCILNSLARESEFLFLNFSFLAGEIQLIVVNNCNHSVWPGTLGNAGHPSPEDGGFHLDAFEETFFDVPAGWSGRIWGRNGCCFDKQGKGSCDTGDCSGRLLCQGMSGAPPATVVEMTFGTTRSPLHYYDVSLVDGFNLPVTMKPIGGGIGCGVAGCEVDLNVCCPSKFEEKRQGKVVGCKSACLALKTDKYCCTGDYGSPKSCKPTLFSHIFKAACPHAYSFAYDDPTSLKTCRASRYLITFCPPAS